MINKAAKGLQIVLILGMCLGLIGAIAGLTQAGMAATPGANRTGGTISGTVACLGLIRGSTDEVLVSLFDAWGSNPLPIDTVHITCGDPYQFDSLPNGTYYLYAFLDENATGGGPPDPGEPGSGEPDPIVISGTSLAHTNIVLEIARYIERVSLFGGKSGLGEEAWDSTDPAISEDGRFVVFYVRDSFYTNRGVYIHDRLEDETHQFSTNDYSIGFDSPDISADGKYVAVTYFHQQEEKPRVVALLVKELGADPENLTVIPPIEDSSPAFDEPSISGNGCRVAFEFIYEDTSDEVRDVYLYDCGTGTTHLISEAYNSSDPGDDFSMAPAISDDGNFVAFASRATNLVSGPTSGDYRIYVRDITDIANPETALIPLPEGFAEAGVGQPSISADGRFVAYHYNYEHIFVYDRLTEVTVMVSPNEIETESPSISGDGRYVAFTGWIYENETWFNDIYVHDLHTGMTKLVTRGLDGIPDDENAGAPDISADGRFVTFWSEDAQLVVDDGNETRDVFVYINEPALTIEIVGAGTVSKFPNESTFDFDTVVVLTPIAGANAVFDGWTGLDSGELIDNEDGTWSITMDTDKVITANFLSSGYTIFLPMIVR